MRFFNTEGPVRPDKHYAVQPLDRMDVEELLALIRARRYFVLHAPRQTGKTSALIALRNLLNSGDVGNFRCVDVNVEVGQVARDDTARGIRAILGNLAEIALAEIAQERRFVEAGCDGLLDEARPDAPHKVGDAEVERVVTMTLETMPRDATHWNTHSMAAASGVRAATVRRIWQAFALKPHRVETFKLSRDPLFIEKVRDIVGLYLHPPERAVVLCVDEKSQNASCRSG